MPRVNRGLTYKSDLALTSVFSLCFNLFPLSAVTLLQS